MRLHFEFLASLKSVKTKNKMQFASFNNEDDIFVFILLGINQNFKTCYFSMRILYQFESIISTSYIKHFVDGYLAYLEGNSVGWSGHRQGFSSNLGTFLASFTKQWLWCPTNFTTENLGVLKRKMLSLRILHFW